ncbi:hypothetical protein GCM10012275_51810 [Longimycelium tulufanense]|uniref:Uncharacterized protein n=1 Tax=Longimycelium tulufanense TaxID=907463 RepID=A0A8J3CJ79_9PSEU|nr:hypothetical protein [Longimycelium tulufanense]GGM74756.1 hypothetical protein GCM10012275_51810 [Longimycelium tulufanense]
MDGPGRGALRSCRAALAIGVLTLPILGGCGDGRSGGTGDERRPPGVTDTVGPPGGERPGRPGEEFTFRLLGGDPDPGNTNAEEVFAALRRGDCHAAQRELNGTWHVQTSPRVVVLYQAAVHACEGSSASHRAAARNVLDRGAAYGGWAGLATDEFAWLGDVQVCRALNSVLRQRPQSETQCPEASTPEWQERNGRRDDPRTPYDESRGAGGVGTTTTTRTTTTTTTTGATTTTPGQP